MENKILATVNGKEITENDLNMAMTRFPQENQAFFATEQGKAQLLEQLISFELVSKYAADEKLDETDSWYYGQWTPCSEAYEVFDFKNRC